MKKNIGIYLFIVVILFSLFGLLMIYSSSYIGTDITKRRLQVQSRAQDTTPFTAVSQRVSLDDLGNVYAGPNRVAMEGKALEHPELYREKQIDALVEELTNIEKETGIPAHNCILHATHTHTGPNVSGTFGWGDIDEKYSGEIFVPGILRAVKRAKAQGVPAKIKISAKNKITKA